MINKVRFSAAWVLALSLVSFALAGTASADQLPHHHGQVIVEEVSATPASTGNRSILRLRLTNDGYNHTHLLGVETPVAAEAWIVARTGDTETTILESITVPPEEALDMTSDHMWIELGSLKRTVELGETIPVELIFLRSRLSVEAHVHGISS